jgi:hypothetical protein
MLAKYYILYYKIYLYNILIKYIYINYNLKCDTNL